MKNKVRILCTREIQRTIRDSVHKLFADRINELQLSNFYTIKNDSIIGANGTEFIFKGLWNNELDIKGTEGIDYCWIEEAQAISKKSLDTLIPTIRNENSEIIFTYNPTNEDDPVHVQFNKTKRADTLKIECNYSDNPFFPEVLRQEMLYDKSTDLDKYFHIWEGKCLKHSQAQVFYNKWAIENFETPTDAMFYFGADWGFSKDPSTLIRCFIKDKRLYIDYEFYGVGIEIDKLPEYFKQVPDSAKYPITADSARPETISYIRRNGFPLIKSSIKGKGSVEDGIEFLKGFEKIIIHPGCKHTIDEFRLYSFKIDKMTGNITNKLEDKDNHCIDSARYALEDLMRHNIGGVGQVVGW